MNARLPEMFGAAMLAQMMGKSAVSVRQAIRRGKLLPDAVFIHEKGTEALWTPETVETLRALTMQPESQLEPICD